MTIGDAMSDPLVSQLAKLKEELESRKAVIAALRRELELKHEYVRGMLDGNPAVAPSVEYLEELVR